MTKLYLRLYKKINIIAFEPLSVFEFKSDQVKLIKAALGAETGSAKFYVCKHNASSSLILPNLSSDWLGRKAKILGLEAKKQEVKCRSSPNRRPLGLLSLDRRTIGRSALVSCRSIRFGNPKRNPFVNLRLVFVGIAVLHKQASAYVLFLTRPL
jgi:hypothetical protein